MARVEKTVFISYRRKDISWALAVYQYLTGQKYDVFFDYTSIPSGDFEQIIVSNIKARAHFVLILTPTALERSNEPGDWLRREIETAIDEKRNIIPLFFEGFSFSSPSVVDKLTEKLGAIRRYNGLDIPSGYFLEAMERLRLRYLNIPLDAVIHPIPTEVQKVVEEQHVAADRALEQEKEVIEELVKPTGEQENGVKVIDWRSVISTLNPRLISGIAGALLLITLSVWGISSLGNSPPPAAPESTQTPSATPTRTSLPTRTNSPPITPVPPTPTLSLGSTLISEKDAEMVLVPRGEFMMGSNDGRPEEEPVHTVYLDNYYIDKFEVINSRYRICVEAQRCSLPSVTVDYTNPEYAEHPVVFVDWNNALAYCEWRGARLPTEAEWEKAARGTDLRRYPWGEDIDETYANYGYYIGRTTPVGTFESGRSFYGAYDMAGNVWELVADWFDENYYSISSSSGPLGPSTGDGRVVRGGAFDRDASMVRTTARTSFPQAETNSTVGFRCAMDASE